MTQARILPHLYGHPNRGLWPVALCRDGETLSVDWLATPIAQALLDASRAGTLDALCASASRRDRPAAEMACGTGV